MKRKSMLAALLLAVTAAAIGYRVCTHKARYEVSFYDVFDTFSQVVVYAPDEKQAAEAAEAVHGELVRLNRLYDIYNNYEGINNIKTVNDNAGVRPVRVDEDLMELLELSVKAYDETDGAVNPAMGAVLSLWHDARESAAENPEGAELPSAEALKKAAEHTDINCLVLDKERGTAYISDSEASLDVGALAKGYAADRAVEVLREKGISSALVNLGGNVAAVGARPDGREWVVGVRNPDNQSESAASIAIKGGSVVTSGDYQRCFEVNGRLYSHIIDGKTLMPAENYRSVTVYAESSAEADILSTALFILPKERGDEIAAKFGAKVCRINYGGNIEGDEAYKY